MATIELTSANLESQLANVSQVLDTGKYSVMISIVPKSEMPLDEYLASGIHTDEKYGPFATTKSLFSSLDA